jgi:predicted double-glycine peptidase
MRKMRKKHFSYLLSALLVGFLTSGCGLNLLREQVPYTVTNHTLKQLRDMDVVKQALDYSCGAAALATLLIYYYGDVTSEAEILELLQSGLTKKELLVKAERGFSLLDLKRTALAKGYRAAGFRLKPGQLMQLSAPVMVFVEPLGYKHFAVLRGVRNGEVYLADPARGNLRMRLDQFVQEWEQGIVFVLGKAGEEQIRNYPLLPPEPFADVRPAYIGFIDFQDQAAQTRNLVFR